VKSTKLTKEEKAKRKEKYRSKDLKRRAKWNHDATVSPSKVEQSRDRYIISRRVPGILLTELLPIHRTGEQKLSDPGAQGLSTR
jgi:hypothetical protein